MCAYLTSFEIANLNKTLPKHSMMSPGYHANLLPLMSAKKEDPS